MGLATMATMASTQRCHEVNEHVNAKELFVGLLVLELATNKWTCKRGATIKIKTPLPPSSRLLLLLLLFPSSFSSFFFFFVSLPEQHSLDTELIKRTLLFDRQSGLELDNLDLCGMPGQKRGVCVAEEKFNDGEPSWHS